MKLELKQNHIKGYLDTGLKFIEISTGQAKEMVGMDNSIIYFKDEMGNYFNEVKPILRPLSDLTKEIEVNGEKFVPSQEYDYLRFDEISNYKGGSNVLNFIQVREQNILLELHFDIHGLIEQKLAIDKNTLL